jgi:D-alanyl-D-alanine carboxypeptidase (penicillin-binding protein 5/6)
MPSSRRQIIRRRRVVVFGLVGVLVAAAFYLPMTLLAPIGGVSAAEEPAPALSQPTAELGWPAVGSAAIGAVGHDGVLGTGGVTEPAPIASISKIVTALVVLQEKPLALGDTGPDIEFTAKDVAIREAYRKINGKVEPVSDGLVLTQRQVMDVMLVESANNYAESLAVWAFGSLPDFVDAANEWLAANDLTATSLVEPTGMSPQNVSTPSDLVALGKLALADPVVATIVATETEDVPGVGELTNSNALLGVDGIKGIKTGTLDEAGACLLFASDYVVGGETVTIVGAVLGGVDHTSLDVAVTGLLATVESGFHEVTLATEGESFGSYTTTWGATSDLVATQDATTVVWSDTPVTFAMTAEDVGLGAAGDDVGMATFTVGEDTFTVPLELAQTIEDPGAWWRMTNPGALF